MTARYTAKDYELVAGVISDTWNMFEASPQRDAMLAYMTTRFTGVFMEDNPSFDVQRFLKASTAVPTAATTKGRRP